MDMKKHLNEIDHEEDRVALEPQLRIFANDIFLLLMGRRPTGNTDAITWVEFKNYRSVCKHRIEDMQKTINLYNIDIKTSRTHSLIKDSRSASKRLEDSRSHSREISRGGAPERNASVL